MKDAGEADAPDAELDAPGSKRDRSRRVRGKWALIDETDVLDFFDSREEAVKAGYARLRDVPFVVRQVRAETD